MFAALGSFVYRRRRATLVVSGIFLVLSIAMLVRGGPLTGGGFGDNEAERTEALVAEVTGTASNNTLVVIFKSATQAPTSEPFVHAMNAALQPLVGMDGVRSVLRPAEAPERLAPAMIDVAQKSAVAMVSLTGSFKEALQRYPGIRARLRSSELSIACTGYVPFMHDFNASLKRDLIKAEMVSLPLALLVLLMVFRTLVAAALPVGVGAPCGS